MVEILRNFSVPIFIYESLISIHLKFQLVAERVNIIIVAAHLFEYCKF